MINKKNSVLDRLKQDSFKKKEAIIESKEIEITAVEKNFLQTGDISFNYNSIQDLEMRKDFIGYESRLTLARNSYHTTAGEILSEANLKYANNKTGMFGAWLEYMQIGKKNAERLINRFKFIKNNCIEVDDKLYFETLPLSLTYEVSAPNADKELVNAVLTRKIKTRKEFISLKNILNENKNEKYLNSDSIDKLFIKLNSNLFSLIESKKDSSTFASDKAKIIYEKINQLENEIKNLIVEIK